MSMWHKGAALAAFALTTGAQAATWYVAPGGNDGGAGTIAAPWQSIAKAQSVAAPGDTVYFRGGDYVYTKSLAACASQTDVVNAITNPAPARMPTVSAPTSAPTIPATSSAAAAPGPIPMTAMT